MRKLPGPGNEIIKSIGDNGSLTTLDIEKLFFENKKLNSCLTQMSNLEKRGLIECSFMMINGLASDKYTLTEEGEKYLSAWEINQAKKNNQRSKKCPQNHLN